MKNENGLYSKPRKATKNGTIKTGDHDIYFRYKKRGDNLTDVVVIHGGPASEMSSEHLRYFSPKKYNVVQIDHRGCGRSVNNNANLLHEVGIEYLVEDIELVRKELGLSKLSLFAMSWGATIALAYAATYPKNVANIMTQSPMVYDEYNRNWLLSETGAASQRPELTPLLEKISQPNFIKAITNDMCEQSIYNWLTWRSVFANKPMPDQLNLALKTRCILSVYYFHIDTFLQNNFDILIKQIPETIKVDILHSADDNLVAPETIDYLKNNLITANIHTVSGLPHSPVNNLQWNHAITELTDSLA